VLRDGKQPVLYLAHATPGDVMGYGNLVYHLRKDQAVCGLSSLGLHDLDRAHDSIEAMAGYYVEHLLKHQPNGPYHLGGWCYGGTVAYEMARQLVAQGHEVALLALIDCYAPLPTNLLAKLRYWFRRVQMLWNRSFPGQMAYVRVKLIPGSPQTLVEPKPSDLPKGTHLVNREVVTEKNMAAIRRYTFRPYPASFDVYLSTQVGDNNLFDPTGAWSLFTDKARYHLLEADHRAILKEPAVRLLADHLQAQLDRDRTC
jgi:thioesterase domain-containing protein